MKKRTIIIVAILASIFAISLTTYSMYRKNASSSTEVTTAEFTYSISAVELSLEDTITNSKPLAPGAEGQIVLNVNLTGTEVSMAYTIDISRQDIPTNLKFYSDSNRTTEITQITGTYALGGTAQQSKTIYWKWVYADDATSNANDSIYMNTDIQVSLSATFNQQIGGGN